MKAIWNKFYLAHKVTAWLLIVVGGFIAVQAGLLLVSVMVILAVPSVFFLLILRGIVGFTQDILNRKEAKEAEAEAEVD